MSNYPDRTVHNQNQGSSQGQQVIVYEHDYDDPYVYPEDNEFHRRRERQKWIWCICVVVTILLLIGILVAIAFLAPAREDRGYRRKVVVVEGGPAPCCYRRYCNWFRCYLQHYCPCPGYYYWWLVIQLKSRTEEICWFNEHRIEVVLIQNLKT